MIVKIARNNDAEAKAKFRQYECIKSTKDSY